MQELESKMQWPSQSGVILLTIFYQKMSYSAILKNKALVRENASLTQQTLFVMLYSSSPI